MYRWIAILLLSLAGCGLLTFPMVTRLSEEKQAQVDDAWKNLFTPPDRLDRTLLLDVLLAMQLHQQGVDRLELVSEKEVGAARVVMSVRFDRTRPSFDEFVISYVDAVGVEARRERYTSGEVKERLSALQWRGEQLDKSNPGEKEARRLRQEEWMRRIYAATQPANAP